MRRFRLMPWRRVLLVGFPFLLVIGVFLTNWVETNIAPSKELFKSMHITPMATAMNAVDRLLGDTSLTGRVVELHGEKFNFAEQKEFADEGTKNNIEMFWKLGYA